jgi:hypothetical protein
VKYARHFYGTCAITLGMWEACAYTTRRVPTVTGFCRARKHPVFRLVVIMWLLGLGRHLLREA